MSEAITGLSVLAGTGYGSFAPEALDGLAALAADAGDGLRAARLATSAAAHRMRMGSQPFGLGVSIELSMPPL